MLLTGSLVLLAVQNLLLWAFLGFDGAPILAAGFAAILYIGWAAARGWTGEAGTNVSYRLLLVCASLATLLLLLGGEAGLFYRNYDWPIRDAVLRDLSVSPWLFVYVGVSRPSASMPGTTRVGASASSATVCLKSC